MMDDDHEEIVHYTNDELWMYKMAGDEDNNVCEDCEALFGCSIAH